MENLEPQVTETHDDDMISVAAEANKLISSKDKEIKDLKVQLARQKLYTTVEDEIVAEPFDPTETVNLTNMTNREVADYAVKLYDYEVSQGKEEFSLGPQAEEIAAFFKHCLDESQDNESFIHQYQLNLGKDRPEDKAAFDKFNRTIKK